MTAASHLPAEEAATLSLVLRTIRRRRGLKAGEIAREMGLGVRTYQYLEAGQSPWDPERIRRFAQATDSDPHAIVAAVMLGSPNCAISAMDNKLVSVLMAGLKRFDERMGEDMARIEVGRSIAAIRRVFGFLESDLAERDAQAKAWLDVAAESAAGPDDREADD